MEAMNSQRSNQKGNGKRHKPKQSSQQSQKLRLPLIFVDFKPRSNIRISQDESKLHMKLQSNKQFAISDENLLFECMGLTKTNPKELSTILDKKFIDFLGSTELVNLRCPSSTKVDTHEESRPISDTSIMLEMVGMHEQPSELTMTWPSSDKPTSDRQYSDRHSNDRSIISDKQIFDKQSHNWQS